MPLNFEDFVAHYRELAPEELVDIARAFDTLTEPAKAALQAEFARRNLDPPLVEDGDEQRPELRSLVTVRRYRDLSEALVARSLLESAGIQTILRDENLVRLEWQISNFIGGIRLQVEAGDESAALELLSQPVPDPIPFASQTGYPQPHCPACNSTHITFEGSSRGLALASLYFFSLPLPLGRATWFCEACARWEELEDDPGGAHPR